MRRDRLLWTFATALVAALLLPGWRLDDPTLVLRIGVGVLCGYFVSREFSESRRLVGSVGLGWLALTLGTLVKATIFRLVQDSVWIWGDFQELGILLFFSFDWFLQCATFFLTILGIAFWTRNRNYGARQWIGLFAELLLFGASIAGTFAASRTFDY